MGQSTNHSLISIPKRPRRDMIDLQINTFLSDNRYNISWTGQNLTNFDLVYCESKTKGPSPTCSNFDVLHVDNETEKFVNSSKTLRFGIALDSEIYWSDCMIDRNFHG